MATSGSTLCWPAPVEPSRVYHHGGFGLGRHLSTVERKARNVLFAIQGLELVSVAGPFLVSRESSAETGFEPGGDEDGQVETAVQTWSVQKKAIKQEHVRRFSKLLDGEVGT